MARTLLAVLVPEAEPLVGELRTRYDPAARRGLGAHITLVYPFVDSTLVTKDLLEQLQAVAVRHAPLRFRLDSVRCFPSTVWLAPDPAAPIAALASDIERAFPERPAVGHAFPHFTPHLTAARNVKREREVIATTLRERLGNLPAVDCCCGQVHVLVSTSGHWKPVAAVTLSGLGNAKGA